MIKKHILAIGLISLAVLAWRAAFYILAPRPKPLVLPPMRQGRSPAKGHRQSTRPAKAPVTDPLAIVLDKRQPTSVQIREIDRLPSNLSEVNQKAILDFIRTAANGHGEYVVKNNLMNCLCRQSHPFPEINAEFIALAADKNQDIVVRAYAVQHLRSLYERSRDPNIKDFLYSAMQETNTEISGGAILVLNYLMNQEEYHSDFDRNSVVQQAKGIALNKAVNNNNRITAIQIASATPDVELANELREIIRDEGSHSALRISAIAGLGKIGDESDIALLEPIAYSKKFERRAAAAAIKQLSVRGRGR